MAYSPHSSTGSPGWRASLLKLVMLLVTVGCGIVFGIALSSCANRVVLVPESQGILRAGPDVRGHVYTEGPIGTWTLSGNKVSIPEGWYLLDLPPEEE